MKNPKTGWAFFEADDMYHYFKCARSACMLRENPNFVTFNLPRHLPPELSPKKCPACVRVSLADEGRERDARLRRHHNAAAQMTLTEWAQKG